MNGDGDKIQPDQYNLSKDGDGTWLRDGKITHAADNSTINAAGALTVGKQVRATADDPWTTTSQVSSPSMPDWQFVALNTFTFDLTNVTFFDRMPVADDGRGSTFQTTLTGAVTGLPDDATVEYSTDATVIDNGTWSNDPTNATAFRIDVDTLASYEHVIAQIPSSVPSELPYGSLGVNDVTGSANYDNNGTPADFEFASSQAQIETVDTGLSLFLASRRRREN